ncbi:MAG: phage tail protein [Desulfobacterales bacterium]|nr:phage tail protein [Desulfobacterales bacterium]
MNEITLKDYSISAPIKGCYVPNSFESYASATEPGIGRFLAYEPQAQINKSDNTNKKLTLTSEILNDSNFRGIHTHDFDVQIGGAAPASIDFGENSESGASSGNDFYEVVCYDLRNDLNVILNTQFNVQKNTEDGLEFITVTLNGGSEFTWAEVISYINNLMPEGMSFVNSGTLPTSYKPRNLSFNSLTIAQCIQVVAAQTFMVVGFNHSTGELSLWDADSISSTNSDLFDKYDDAVTKIFATDAFLRNNAAMPKNYTCSFPIIYQESVDSADRAAEPFYEKEVEVNGVGRASSRPMHMGNYLAEHDGSSVQNQAALNAVASEMALRAFNASQNSSPTTYEYPMVVPFVHDGYVRNIRWTDSTTVIQTGNDKSSNPLMQMSRNIEQIANATSQVFSGVVSGTASGTMVVPTAGGAEAGGIPSGVIVMWSGAINAIPSGWSLCDGGGDRPDMRGQFVVGSYDGTGVVSGGVAGAFGQTGDYAVPGETGGKTYHGLTENNHSDHIDHLHMAAGPETVQSGSGATVASWATTGIQKTGSGGYLEVRHGAETSDGLNTTPVQDPVSEHPDKADTDNRPAWYCVAYIIKD